MTPAEFTAARKSLGLSQAQLAPLFGRSTRQVKNWERHGPDDMAAILMQFHLITPRESWPKSPDHGEKLAVTGSSRRAGTRSETANQPAPVAADLTTATPPQQQCMTEAML